MISKNSKILPVLMWLLPLFFFTYQFILRLWPGLMMQEIMGQFSVSAEEFGLIAAFYYYGYAGMQIPVAILLDKYGARITVFVFATICGLATLLFSYTHNWYLGCIARFLIGAGSAVGFLSVSKVISEWFPKQQYTKMVGFSFSVGLLGAIYGGKPVGNLIESYPWQSVALSLAIIAIAIGSLSLIFLRSPKISSNQSVEFQLSHFNSLLRSPAIWMLAIANLLMVGSLEGFSDVWGVPYLMTAFSISKSDAAGLVSFVFFGMLIGGPILAFFSNKIGNYPVIMSCGIGMALAFLFLLFDTTFNWYLLACVFFLIGILCCYQVIVFSAGSGLVSTEQLGVTVAFLNCINMLGGSFFHSVIGHLMDNFWEGNLTAFGIKIYTLTAYHEALMIIPICSLIGAVISFALHKKQQIINR